MKRFIYLLLFMTLISSCSEPYIIQNSISEKYQEALDTLINYDNYFIGEFNGELLISVEPFTSGSSIFNTLQDSVTKSFMYSYKIANSDELKTPFLYFQVYESIDKFDSNNYWRYTEYSDFYNFFNRYEVNYWNLVDNYKNKTPEITIGFIDYSQIVNNTGTSYSSTDFEKPPFNENNFFIENIEEVDNPLREIKLTYSFNCTLFSDTNELIEIKNGKGKCTIKY